MLLSLYGNWTARNLGTSEPCPASDNSSMPKKTEIVVDKNKFDALLTRMLNTPPLPKAEIKVAHPKPKNKKRK
jgi:hypothetical protein